MHCKQLNTNQSLWSADSRAMIGRMTADIWCPSADGSLINCHRQNVWRSSADWRPMIGRPSADIMMKKSSKHRPIIGRPLPDASPMTKPLKIGGSVNETFNYGVSTKTSSADQQIFQNRCRRRPTIGRRRPIFPFLAHRPSGDRRFAKCDCSITADLLIKSDLKWCIHISRSLFLYFNYLVSVTAGGPVSPRGHM